MFVAKKSTIYHTKVEQSHVQHIKQHSFFFFHLSCRNYTLKKIVLIQIELLLTLVSLFDGSMARNEAAVLLHRVQEFVIL